MDLSSVCTVSDDCVAGALSSFTAIGILSSVMFPVRTGFMGNDFDPTRRIGAWKRIHGIEFHDILGFFECKMLGRFALF